MDQVIEYLKRQCASGTDNDALSGAMINNYIKDKILPRTNDKRYNKEHLAYLIIISRLKQVLPVKDIGIILSLSLIHIYSCLNKAIYLLQYDHFVYISPADDVAFRIELSPEGIRSCEENTLIKKGYSLLKEIKTLLP